MKEPKQTLIITKKLKGEDGHKTFSVRLKDGVVESVVKGTVKRGTI